MTTQTMEENTKETMTIQASNVTGSAVLPVEVERSLPGSAVAKTIASMMALPADTTYALRDDQSSVYLDDRPIGEQVAPGAQVTLAPKTHLGSRP